MPPGQAMWSSSSSALKRLEKRFTMRLAAASVREMPYVASTLSPNSRGVGRLPLMD
jgi:hypothetical protein